MESGFPFARTTLNGLSNFKHPSKPGTNESAITEKAADSTVRNNEENNKDGGNAENDGKPQLIKGLSRPSPELEKVDFPRVSFPCFNNASGGANISGSRMSDFKIKRHLKELGFLKQINDI